MSSNPTVYVGVDIGWSCKPKPNSTGLATIEGDELVELGSAQTVVEVFPRPTIEAVIGDVSTYKNDTKAIIHSGLEEIWRRTTDGVHINFGEHEALIPAAPSDVLKADLKQLGDQYELVNSDNPV